MEPALARHALAACLMLVACGWGALLVLGGLFDREPAIGRVAVALLVAVVLPFVSAAALRTGLAPGEGVDGRVAWLLRLRWLFLLHLPWALVLPAMALLGRGASEAGGVPVAIVTWVAGVLGVIGATIACPWLFARAVSDGETDLELHPPQQRAVADRLAPLGIGVASTLGVVVLALVW